MTASGAQTTPVDNSSPLEPTRLLRLYAQPKRFFDPAHNLDRRPELYLVVLLAGIATVLDRIDLRLTKATLVAGARPDDFAVRLAESWPSLWTAVVLLGIVSGAFGWLIGGWWYGVRLHLSGAPKNHEKEARLTWAYVALVTSLPTFVLLLVQTVQYSNYLEAYDTGTIATLLVVALLYWSVIVSYQAATTRFKLTRSKARFWFLILPLVFYTAILFLFGALAALLSTNGGSVPA